MIVRTEIFDCPSTTGSHAFDISGWSDTPVACKIVVVGRASAGYTADAIIGIGFTDGTTDYCISARANDSVSSSETSRATLNHIASALTSDSTTPLWDADFVSWNTGGVDLTFSGSPSSSHSLMITFFAGADVEADVLGADPGTHVESLSFTSKLIFSAYTNDDPDDGGYNRFTLSHGVCTNGTNGVEQNSFGYTFNNNVSSSEMEQAFTSGYIATYVAYTSIQLQTAISSIDSVGFNLSDTETYNVIFLCLDFDEDVDSGYAAMPTSTADITNTVPGFIPQCVGIVSTRNTTLNTIDLTTAQTNICIGEYDGTTEASVSVSGEDATASAGHSSHIGTSIIEMEDQAANDDGDFSFDAFTANGFDLTNNTPADAAGYYFWWAVESAYTSSPITGSTTTSSTVSGDIVGLARISGGAGLGADLKDAEEINDDANWVAYGTATVSQNGAYVNIVSGSNPSGAYISLTNAVCLSSNLTVGEKYSIRGVVVSDDAAGNVRFSDSGGSIDTVAFTTGVIARFALTGEYTGSSPIIDFENLSSGEELDILVESVSPVDGSSNTGDIKGNSELSGTVTTSSSVSGDVGNAGSSFLSGTITTSSTVSADVLGKTELSGTVNTASTISGDAVGKVYASGAISTSSTTSADVKGTSTLSGSINTVSNITLTSIDYKDIITQNGDWVNIVSGSTGNHATMSLNTTVLTRLLNNDEKCVVRGIAWSESGAMTITLNDEAAGGSPRDSVAVSDGGIVRFDLHGKKTAAGDDPFITFSNFTEGEELNIYIYAVTEVVGSSTAGDIHSGTPPHDYITGSISTSSTVSGAVLGNTELSGAVATSSTVSANLTAVVPITGTISTSSSTVTDIIGTQLDFSGTISTSSTVFGDIRGGFEFTGTITTSSTVSGAIQATMEISGTISTSSTTSADVTGTTSIEGTINTSSTVSGYVVTPTSEISGAISTGSTVAGDIHGEFELEGSITTSSTVSGDLVGVGPLTASVSTSSTVRGDLILASEKKWITGSVSTFSTVAGDLILASEKKWISGSIATSSSIQADLSRLYITLSGIIPTGTTVAGDISYTAKLRGSISTSSTIFADLISAGAWAGSIVTFSQVDGTIRAYNRRTVSISTSSTVAGDLVIGAQKGFITGSVSTSSTVSADLVIGAQKGWMTSTVQTSSTVQADLSYRYITLAGSIQTSSTTSADLTYSFTLLGSIQTGSTVSGAVATPFLSGLISTFSTLSARLRIHGGSIQTGSTVAGFIKAYGRAAASVSTSSTVAGDLVIGAQRQWISGSISSGATVAGDLTIGARRRWISGSIASGATVSGDLIVGRTKGWITGTVTTGTTISAGISYKVHVSGSVSTISAVSGSLKGVGSIESNVITASSVDGVVIGRVNAAGAITTSTTLAATMVGRTQMSGNVQTESIPDAHLSGRYELQGSMLTYSQITADVKAWGVLGGVSLGYSEVEGLAREKGVPRDWWDIFVPSDDLEGLVVTDPSFKAQAGQEIHELVCSEGEMGLWVYENDFGIPVLENTFIGIVDDDVAIGGIEGTGKGTWLEDHDGVDILDHDGAKIYI